MNDNSTLWFRRPAEDWHEAMPLGNGRMGAMVFGGTEVEKLQLNEDTLWSGRPGDEDGYQISENIEGVRKLLREKKYSQANDLTDEMTGAHDTESYQMVGDLLLDFKNKNEVKNYERRLDLNTGITSTTYLQESVRHERECFISHPHQVLAMRLKSDAPGGIGFGVSMDSMMAHKVVEREGAYLLQGQCPFNNHSRRPNGEDKIVWEKEGVSGIKYVVKIKLIPVGGNLEFRENSGLVVSEANEVLLLMAIKTSFRGWNEEPHDDLVALEKECDKMLQSASEAGWDRLKKEHVEDFGAFSGKMALDLGAVDSRATDERLRNHHDIEEKSALVNLVFNFGRYLMISSSRAGTQPTNLQGIWNDKLVAPWRSNYTVSINTEMNYWPSETCNLSELSEPLLKMVRELSESGKRPAKKLYGARGWCVHHNVDLWRYAYTGGARAQHAFWPVCSAWLCQHVWEHYVFSENKSFLQEFLPIMKGAAEFFLDFMVVNEEGKLTTSPSTSPENRFIDPGTGELSSVCEGSAMDLTMIRELFENILEGSEELGESDSVVDEVREALEKLAMPKIGADGRLLEFGIEAEEPAPDHRHISHLYGAYPGWMFTPDHLPEYYEACRKSLDARGDESTGWAMGWRVAMWARFGDGERALKVIGNLLRFIDVSSKENYQNGGGLYANLFDAHPPFQIDGNFGVTAGIAEMIVQSHEKGRNLNLEGSGISIPEDKNPQVIDLLPALPASWPRGEMRGIRVRGGFEVDIKWSEGKPSKMTLSSSLGNTCLVRHEGSVRLVETEVGKKVQLSF